MRRLLTIVVLAVLAVPGCGPELTTPARTSVTGMWESVTGAGCIAELRLELQQSQTGFVTGGWTGDSVATGGSEPPDPDEACITTGVVDGSHNVLHLALHIADLGNFTGQHVAPDTIRGTVIHYQLNTSHPVVFVRTTD